MSEHGVDELMSVDEAIRIIDSVPVAPGQDGAAPASRREPFRLPRDVASDRDYPPFDKALMDGFVVRSADFAGGADELELVGEVAAGGNADIAVPPGKCVAIMTGAAVPADADAVLPVEVSQAAGGRVRFSKRPRPGDAISKRGADLKHGELVLKQGTPIGPAQVGAIVQVGGFDLLPDSLFESASTLNGHVLVTGDEIVDERDVPGDRQIRDVNGPMFVALLASLGVRAERSRVVDDEALTRTTIDQRAREAHLLFVTGGMSMGKYDYVPRALIDLGFDLKITKLRIKPGKPFVFALRQRKEKTDFVFGLPGNPVSGFCCTLRLASRLIARMQGGVPSEPSVARLVEPLPRNGPREFYQPAIFDNGLVTPLAWKGSADVFTLARANAMIIRPIDEPTRAIGDEVRIVRF